MSLTINNYFNLERSADAVRKGTHRRLVGGLWDEVGQLQFDYVKDHGLAAGQYVLDIGCGCLRGGIHFVRYLEPGHYYGTDISQDLLDAGYDVELAAIDLQDKLPRQNLACDDKFDVERFGVVFDVVMAQSLFTHLPMNHLKLCLAEVAKVVRIGGKFYVTVFHCAESQEWGKPIEHTPGRVVSHPINDPYHYSTADIEYCSAGLPWSIDMAGDWQHPRAQQMIIFTRTE